MRQHYKIQKQMDKRIQSALDLLTALAIGVGLAFALVHWWSA